MPMLDFVAEAVAGIARAVGEFVVEVVMQPVLEVTGYWALRPFVRRAEKRPGLCVLVGLAVWLVAGGVLLWLSMSFG